MPTKIERPKLYIVPQPGRMPRVGDILCRDCILMDYGDPDAANFERVHNPLAVCANVIHGTCESEYPRQLERGA